MSVELEALLRDARPSPPVPPVEVIARARATALAEIEAFARVRRRPSRRRLRWLFSAPGLGVATGLVGAAIGLGIGLSVGTNSSNAGVRIEGTLTPRLGIRVVLPSGWSGRIYNSQPATAPAAAFVHLANFPLPSGDDDFGTKATQKMRGNSILIVVLETTGAKKHGFHYPQLAAPLQISAGDLLPMFQGVPPSHAFARRLFSSQGRRFMLWVQFGRKRPGGLVGDANRVLRTIQFTSFH